MNPQSGLYQALALAADIVIVNVLMILSAIPVVTAGAGLRAGNYVIGQLVAEEGSQPIRTFASQFVKNAGASTAWWLMTLCLAALGVGEWLVLDNASIGANLDFIFRAGLMSAALIITGISLWFFYLEARQPRGFTTTFSHAALAAFRFLPRTFLGVAMVMLPFVLVALMPARTFTVVAFYLVVGVALTIYLFHLLVLNHAEE